MIARSRPQRGDGFADPANALADLAARDRGEGETKVMITARVCEKRLAEEKRSAEALGRVE